MKLASPNRHVLEAVASKLEPVIDDLVFVGGQVVELLLTDPAAVRIRATTDVDVVVAGTRSDYHRMEDRLRELGFDNDMSDGAPICRWRTEDGYVLDLMPVDETVPASRTNGMQWRSKELSPMLPAYLNIAERSKHGSKRSLLSIDIAALIPRKGMLAA